MRFLSLLLPLMGAASIVAPAAASAQPRPPTAEEVVEEGRQLILGAIEFDMKRCGRQPDTDEIIVCGADDVTESQRLGPSTRLPEAPTFTGRRGGGSAFDEAACAAQRCVPQAQIDVIGVARTLRRGLGRVFGGD